LKKQKNPADPITTKSLMLNLEQPLPQIQQASLQQQPQLQQQSQQLQQQQLPQPSQPQQSHQPQNNLFFLPEDTQQQPLPLPQQQIPSFPSQTQSRPLITVISSTCLDDDDQNLDDDDPWLNTTKTTNFPYLQQQFQSKQQPHQPDQPQQHMQQHSLHPIQQQDIDQVVILPEEKSRVFLTRVDHTSQPNNQSNSHPILNVARDPYQQQQIDEGAIQFSEKEKEILLRLPNKEYLLENEIVTMMGLVDIIFSYAYDYRINIGESTVESAWNIAKISPTLSWFDKFTDVSEVICACVRRSLCFPLYRHWELSKKILQDTLSIFRVGKRAILKCLLNVRHIFQFSDTQHALNRLYIDHYCVWIQTVSRKKLHGLVKAMKQLKLTKKDSGWYLLKIEKLALQAEKTGQPMDLDLLDSGSEENEDDENNKTTTTQNNKTLI